MHDWSTSGWVRYDSKILPWTYAITLYNTYFYINISEKVDNMAEDAPHDTGFVKSVKPERYTYYGDGGAGFDIVTRKYKGKNLYNFMSGGKIIFYLDFTNYL